MIPGSFSYQLYNWLLVASICLSFAVFLGIVLLGIRKKMKYILKLSDEIAILEGGSLDYSITVKGKDELAMLAEGILTAVFGNHNVTEQTGDYTLPENLRSFYDGKQKKAGCECGGGNCCG